jgi:hypothetical protein
MLSLIRTLLQPKTATESDLRREFESFGSIERVRIVREKKGRSRGYAFIVFERERDMKGNNVHHLILSTGANILFSNFSVKLLTRSLIASSSWEKEFLSTLNEVAPFEVGNPVDLAVD